MSYEIKDIEGYYRKEDLEFIIKILTKIKAKVVVELGVHQGRSAVAIAENISGGILYCIDDWQGIVNENFKKCFLSNLEKYQIKNIVYLHSKSTIVAKTFNYEIDLIHIDAGHKPIEVYSDIVAWMKYLRNDSVIIGHDWNNPEVMEGVKKAEEDGLIRGLQDLAYKENAPICETSPTPDKLCLWTAYKR